MMSAYGATGLSLSAAIRDSVSPATLIQEADPSVVTMHASKSKEGGHKLF